MLLFVQLLDTGVELLRGCEEARKEAQGLGRAWVWYLITFYRMEVRAGKALQHSFYAAR